MRGSKDFREIERTFNMKNIKVITIMLLCIAIFTGCGNKETPIDNSMSTDEVIVEVDTKYDFFNSFNSDTLVELINSDEYIKNNFVVYSEKDEHIYKVDGKFWMEETEFITGSGINDGSDYIYAVINKGDNGKMHGGDISIVVNENDIQMAMDALNRVISIISNNSINNEIANVMIGDTNNIEIMTPDGKVRIDYNKQIETIDYVEFIPDSDREAKIDNYIAQLIDSGVSQEEIDNTDTSEMFGEYKSTQKNKVAVTIGVEFIEKYEMREMASYCVTDEYSEILEKSGIISVNSDLLNDSTYAGIGDNIHIDDVHVFGDTDIEVSANSGSMTVSITPSNFTLFTHGKYSDIDEIHNTIKGIALNYGMDVAYIDGELQTTQDDLITNHVVTEVLEDDGVSIFTDIVDNEEGYLDTMIYIGVSIDTENNGEM